jgi:hypothetical protein
VYEHVANFFMGHPLRYRGLARTKGIAASRERNYPHLGGGCLYGRGLRLHRPFDARPNGAGSVARRCSRPSFARGAARPVDGRLRQRCLKDHSRRQLLANAAIAASRVAAFHFTAAACVTDSGPSTFFDRGRRRFLRPFVPGLVPFGPECERRAEIQIQNASHDTRWNF